MGTACEKGWGKKRGAVRKRVRVRKREKYKESRVVKAIKRAAEGARVDRVKEAQDEGEEARGERGRLAGEKKKGVEESRA